MPQRRRQTRPSAPSEEIAPRPEFVIVLTTMPADDDTELFASSLVQDRLAACVNVLPEMDSYYRWEGQVEADRERQLVIKTTAARLQGLLDRMRELHPFEVPELLVLPVVDGLDAYLRWVLDSTRPAADDRGDAG